MVRKDSRMMRVFAFPFLCFWLIISTVVYGGLCVICGPFSMKIAQRIAKAWCRHLLGAIGVRVHLTGAEKLDLGNRYVFFSNHQSALDIPVIYSGLPHPLSFIAKKELFMIPFLGWGMAALGHVSIDRSSARKARQSIDRGVDHLKRHFLSLILFPEGTRSPDGKLGQFKKGSFALGLAAGVKVVPLAIRKASERLPKKSLLVRPGVVYLDIGDPFETAGMGKDVLAERVREAIEKIVNSGIE
jgi:1-acyl-sn-glycerol-3-phosphate acyltransferase